MAEPNLPSKTSPSYALTTLIIFRFGRAGRDRYLILTGADTVAHHFNAICGGAGGVCRGPRRTTSFGPQHELPLARLVIYRQTSAMKQRIERLKVRFEVGHISRFLPPATLAVDNGRALHYWRAPRGGCCSGGRLLRSLSAEFWARNH